MQRKRCAGQLPEVWARVYVKTRVFVWRHSRYIRTTPMRANSERGVRNGVRCTDLVSHTR